MKKHWLVICVILGACSKPDPRLQEAENHIRAALKDGDSARIKNLRVIEKHGVQDGVVCAEVNGKNSYGGYEGYKTTSYNPNGDHVNIDNDGNDSTLKDICS